jgi:Protein of unknown function (DUF3592)
MSIVIGAWFALAGGLAALAGLAGMRRVRHLRRHGRSAWATAVPAAGEPARRTMIQYALADGRVMEQLSPQPARRSASLRPGQSVLVWYDPADPQDVLVYGREGRLSDRAFTVAGLLLILAGAAVAALA